MIMISSEQMRQYNGCESVKTDEIFNLQLGSGADTWVGIPCPLQDTNQNHCLRAPKQSTKKKQKNMEKHETPKKLYQTALAYVHRAQG